MTPSLRCSARLLCGITVLLAARATAQAPGPTAEFGVAREWATTPGAAPLTTLLPSVAYDRGWWRAEGGVSGGVASEGRGETSARFAGMIRGPRIGPFGTEVAADYVTPTRGFPSTEFRSALRMHWSGAARGLWAGLGHARVGGAGTLLASGGGWWSGRHGTLSLRFDDAVGGARSEDQRISDTLILRRTLPSIRTRSAVARFAAFNGRFELEAGSPIVDAPGAHGRRDAGASGTWWFTPTLGVIGGYGIPFDGVVAGSRSAARLGVLLRHGQNRTRPSTLAERAAAQIAPLGEGRWRIRIPAPGAGRVEVQGTGTGWEPVELTRSSGGWWEVTLALPAGRHEFIWRRDDTEWRALPGLPTAADPMLGDVTVVVAEE